MVLASHTAPQAINSCRVAIGSPSALFTSKIPLEAEVSVTVHADGWSNSNEASTVVPAYVVRSGAGSSVTGTIGCTRAGAVVAEGDGAPAGPDDGGTGAGTVVTGGGARLSHSSPPILRSARLLHRHAGRFTCYGHAGPFDWTVSDVQRTVFGLPCRYPASMARPASEVGQSLREIGQPFGHPDVDQQRRELVAPRLSPVDDDHGLLCLEGMPDKTKAAHHCQ